MLNPTELGRLDNDNPVDIVNILQLAWPGVAVKSFHLHMDNRGPASPIGADFHGYLAVRARFAGSESALCAAGLTTPDDWRAIAVGRTRYLGGSVTVRRGTKVCSISIRLIDHADGQDAPNRSGYRNAIEQRLWDLLALQIARGIWTPRRTA